METTELSLATLEVTKLDALIQLMFLAAYADGETQEEERAVFRDHMTRTTNGALPPALIEGILEQFERSLKGADVAARLESIRRRLPDLRMRKAALALAVRVVMADRVLNVDEETFIARVTEALELEPAEAEALLARARAGEAL